MIKGGKLKDDRALNLCVQQTSRRVTDIGE